MTISRRVRESRERERDESEENEREVDRFRFVFKPALKWHHRPQPTWTLSPNFTLQGIDSHFILISVSVPARVIEHEVHFTLLQVVRLHEGSPGCSFHISLVFKSLI